MISDNVVIFGYVLKECGLIFVKGDWCGYVVVIYEGEVLFVVCYIGKKVKEVCVKFGEVDMFLSVDEVKM